MNARKLTAGDTVEARCTRCRAILNHTIVAMVGERVVRVECNTCRGTHNYHAAAAPKATVAASPKRKTAPAASRAPAKVSETAMLEEWEALREKHFEGSPAGYDMGASYRVNTLVEHPVFGLGFVKTVMNPNKMEVLFRTGKKLLRCA